MAWERVLWLALGVVLTACEAQLHVLPRHHHALLQLSSHSARRLRHAQRTMQRVRPRQKAAQNTAQAQSTALITAEQSLSTVKTLVETSIGCLMFLRGFFSDQNFVDQVVEGGTAEESSRMRNDAPMRVKQLKKGVTAESDLIIKLWEEGVQDALEKHYLASLILGIYLDEENDNDIVEAYTFNFSYGEVEGTKQKVPLLNLTESMRSVSIYDQGGAGTAATAGGNTLSAPTIRTVVDVRRQVQLLIRALITMSQSFQDLPRKRFLTMRLRYTDDVPLDYEPPGFIGGTPQERLLFSTPTIGHRPDQLTIGAVDTGFHGVNIHLATLAPFLRRAPDEPGMTHYDLQREDAELQREDAAERRVIWNAEESADMHQDNLASGGGQGEAEPVLSQEERRKREKQREANIRLGLESSTVSEPVGVRLPDGTVAPMPPSAVREAEERQDKRLRGEDVSDEEDVLEPVAFVVKHIKQQSDALLTPQTTNAIIAQLAVSPPGAGATTATGTSRNIMSSVPHPAASLPLQKPADAAASHAGASPTFEPPPRSSSEPLLSSPLAHRSQLTSDGEGIGATDNQAMDIDFEEGVLAKELTQRATNSHSFTPSKNGLVVETESPRRSTSSTPSSLNLSRTRIEERNVQRSDDSGAKQMAVADASMAIDPDETRVEPASQAMESINSFTQSDRRVATQEHDSIETADSGGRRTRSSRGLREDAVGSPQKQAAQKTPKETASVTGGFEDDTVAVACACDDPSSAGLTISCDDCHRWMHAHCYGYLITTKQPLPDTFTCYNCKLAGADMLTEDEKVKMLAELGTLALTRHALDVLYNDGWPGDVGAFAEAIGASLANARSILNRCEAEGFIRRGEDGATTASQSSKATSKMAARSKAKSKAMAAKTVTVLKGNVPRHKLKKRYFTPGGGVEAEILAPWLRKSSVGGKGSGSVEKGNISDASQTSSQEIRRSARVAGASVPATHVGEKDVAGGEQNSTSSQTAVHHPPTSTPSRAAARRAGTTATLSTPLTRSASKALAADQQRYAGGSVTRSASKRKMLDPSDGLGDYNDEEERQRAELARKRRNKTSRPGARIQLGDFGS